jgi:transposase
MTLQEELGTTGKFSFRRDRRMNPVIGLDIAKGESQGQAFLDKGQPYGKSFTIIHTREGLQFFHQLLKDLEATTGQKPTVILEATGHYNAPVTQFLRTFSVPVKLN